METERIMRLSPYLNFNGRCAEAFRFYERVLGGTIEGTMTFGEMPGTEDVPADWPANWRDWVMHTRLVVGDQVLMGSDSPPNQYEKPQGTYVALQVDGPAEAERIFHAFAEGGTVTMPLQETFWAIRFGMVVDRFGTPWSVNCERQA